MNKNFLLTFICVNIINMTSAMEQESKNMSLQILESFNASKRLKMEVSQLLEDKKFTIDVCSLDSKVYPCEIKIDLCDDKVKHVLAWKMPHDYPFKAPVLVLNASHDQFDAKDLIVISRDLNNDLRQIWSPARRISEITDMVNIKIRSYQDEKVAAEQVAAGYERTFAHLREKYQSSSLILGGKYPEFQEKLNGLWVKEMPSGYFVFHVEGDCIDIAFEFKYINKEPLVYRGDYAAGYHDTNDNKFNIHISDSADLGKINSFNILVDSDLISMMFVSLKYDSILSTIISQLKLKMDDIIGSSINLSKV